MYENKKRKCGNSDASIMAMVRMNQEMQLERNGNIGGEELRSSGEREDSNTCLLAYRSSRQIKWPFRELHYLWPVWQKYKAEQIEVPFAINKYYYSSVVIVI